MKSKKGQKSLLQTPYKLATVLLELLFEERRETDRMQR